MIKFLTLTGADDTVDPESLLKLSEKYPFVEWGILMSAKQLGKPRYPSTDWIDSLAMAYHEHPKFVVINLSAHLCGSLVREFLRGQDVFSDLGADVFEMFNRIQINTGSQEQEWNLPAVVTLINSYPEKTFIFQLAGNETNEAMAKLLVLEHGLKNVSFLFDKSGGRGTFDPSGWMMPQTQKGSYGYAGGLGPDNIKEELPKIIATAEKRSDNKCGIWIDMETKLRTGGENDTMDMFDLDKCQQVLEIVTPMYYPG